MKPLETPCPKCSAPVAAPADSPATSLKCSACGHVFDSPRPAALPQRRAAGEKPRTHAVDTVRALGTAGEPVPAHAKSHLPTQRQTDRTVSETIPTPTVLPDRPKAELPSRRAADEKTRLREPVAPPTREPEPTPAPAVPEKPAAPAAKKAAPTPAPVETGDDAGKPSNFRLGENRRLRLMAQGEIDGDVEASSGWGSGIDEVEQNRRRNRRLIVIGSAVAIPLVAALLVIMFTHQFAPPAPEPKAAPGTVSGGNPADEARAASALVRQYMEAQTIDEKLKYVRHPETTRPRMEGWYSPTNPPESMKVTRFGDRTEEQTLEGVTFVMLFMELADHTVRPVAVEKTKEGFRVDWESFVGWSSVSWEDFLKNSIEEPTDFPVTVQNDTYYNYAYADESKFFCYKLTDPKNWASCWGYVGIDSAVGQRIAQMIRRQRNSGLEQIKAVLKLRFEPAAKGKNQVWIVDVVQDGWVRVNP